MTRNQVAFTGSWVRIPPLPPKIEGIPFGMPSISFAVGFERGVKKTSRCDVFSPVGVDETAVFTCTKRRDPNCLIDKHIVPQPKNPRSCERGFFYPSRKRWYIIAARRISSREACISSAEGCITITFASDDIQHFVLVICRFFETDDIQRLRVDFKSLVCCDSYEYSCQLFFLYSLPI